LDEGHEGEADSKVDLALRIIDALQHTQQDDDGDHQRPYEHAGRNPVEVAYYIGRLQAVAVCFDRLAGTEEPGILKNNGVAHAGGIVKLMAGVVCVFVGLYYPGVVIIVACPSCAVDLFADHFLGFAHPRHKVGVDVQQYTKKKRIPEDGAEEGITH